MFHFLVLFVSICHSNLDKLSAIAMHTEIYIIAIKLDYGLGFGLVDVCWLDLDWCILGVDNLGMTLAMNLAHGSFHKGNIPNDSTSKRILLGINLYNGLFNKGH